MESRYSELIDRIFSVRLLSCLELLVLDDIRARRIRERDVRTVIWYRYRRIRRDFRRYAVSIHALSFEIRRQQFSRR